MLISLLDGYLDEPSNLGVPPFISPQVRYMAGAMMDAGHDVLYVTIDSYRSSKPVQRDLYRTNMLVTVAGVSVPGRYVRGNPVSFKEAIAIAERFKGPSVLAGPMVMGRKGGRGRKGLEDAFDHVLEGDPDAQVHDALNEGLGPWPKARKRTSEEWTRWSVNGASVVEHHPDFPQPLIAEVDVYKGCPRFHTGGCSFCSEVLQGPPRFREPEEVAAEVEALARNGVTNFRLACPCIVSYKAKGIREGRIVPSPPDVKALLEAVASAAKGCRVLHVDNADPSVIARNPEESEVILKALVDHCTSGNILSLGMESADPAVIGANNLNSTPEEVLEAIRAINRVGKERGTTGLPELLPGLNFIAGLEGETSGTFGSNLEFLKGIVDEGLLVRRINIRQVMGHRRTFPGVRKRKDFMRFKTAVREDVDRPMLKMLLPRGTVLKDLYIEYRKGGITFARQVGTYPILVGIPAPLDLEGLFDAAVVDWGHRSVTAIPYPLDLNDAGMALLSALPGIGKKRAARIIRARPFTDLDQVSEALDDPDLLSSMEPFILDPGKGKSED